MQSVKRFKTTKLRHIDGNYLISVETILTFAPRFLRKVFTAVIYIIMAVTRLKRKSRVNRAVANNKTAEIKRLGEKPMIKKVDVEELKAEFAK